MFQTEAADEIKSHFMFSKFFFLKSCSLWDNVEKYGSAREATDANTEHVHCLLDT